MKRAPPEVECHCGLLEVCGCFILPPLQLDKSIQTRRDWATRLVYIFWGCFFSSPSREFSLPWEDADCSTQPSRALITMTYGLPSTHCAPFSAYIPFSSRAASVLSSPWSIAGRWRCVSLPDLTCCHSSATAIYGSHFLPSQSWRSKRCKCHSVSP